MNISHILKIQIAFPDKLFFLESQLIWINAFDLKWIFIASMVELKWWKVI